MSVSPALAEDMLQTAVKAVETGGDLLSALDALPAPIYVADRNGLITYFNPACIAFAGREPAVGKDQWCVTWRLYTDAGEALPHDQCPMAQAIREARPIRGVTATAERPDGVRVRFMPFPTPLFGADDRLLGAVNMLIDITDTRQIEELRSQAERCRRLVRSLGDRVAVTALSRLAEEYDAKAAELGAMTATAIQNQTLSP